jgi:N6-adenosine-specific RNA methylase IME4
MTEPEEHSQHAGLDELRCSLDKAESIEQVLSIYRRILEIAKELRRDPELRNRAAELKLLTQRKMGRLLAEQHLRGGDRKSSRASQRLHLKDVGISNTESARWQREAAVPEAIFAQYCRDKEARGREPTSRGLVARDRERVFSLISTGLRAMCGDGQRFPCIHAAPPWPGEHERECDPKAATDEMARCLCELPVKDVSAERAHLYLWATQASLPQATQVLAAWGFQYASFLPCKKADAARDVSLGRGSELLLLGVRGNLPFAECVLPAWLEGRIISASDHLREFRGLIERISPPPYLDLFGNLPVSGWAVAGLEAGMG